MSTRLFLPDGVDPVTNQPTKLSSVSPINPQVQQQYQQALGITPPPASAPLPTAAPPPANNAAPTTVFVNNSQEYGNYSQMGPPGSLLLFQPQDPGFPAVMAAAQAQGYRVGIWIPQGQGPSDGTQYGQYMASLYNTYHPALIVSNAETASKNATWNDQAAGAAKAGGVPTANIGLAVEPNQTINYKPWTTGGGKIFVENFGGSGSAVGDPTAQTQHLVAQGVPAGQISVMGYRTGGSGYSSQFGPVPNWWQQSGGGPLPPEHGTNPPPGSSGPLPANTSGPLAPGSIPPEHGNPQTGGPTGPTSLSRDPRTLEAIPAISWEDYFFGGWGLDDADKNQLVEIMKKYTDPNDAVMAALAYIRGTNWYAQHFPGIKQGIAKGLFSDEAGYRDYVNRVNVVSQQYLGRAVSGSEILGYLNQGVDPSTVGKFYARDAWATANMPDVQYELGAFGPGRLTGEQGTAKAKALAGEQVGLDSALGQKIQIQLQKAMQQMQGMFQSQLQTPSLNAQNGLNAPSLQGQKQTPDIGA